MCAEEQKKKKKTSDFVVPARDDATSSKWPSEHKETVCIVEHNESLSKTNRQFLFLAYTAWPKENSTNGRLTACNQK